MINADIQTVEYSFIKIPYESAVKSFKQQRKSIEKEISSILNSIIQLKKQDNFDKVQVENQIESLILRLKELKKQLNNYQQENNKIYESCTKRIEHLKSIAPNVKESQMDYHNLRTKRLIVEELTRNGNIQVAKKLCNSYQIEDYCQLEINLIELQNQIINDLKDQKTHSAMDWCKENSSKLQKLKNDFEFKLIQQEFIQLLKQKKSLDAIKYLRQYSEKYKKTQQGEINKICMCITYQKKQEMDEKYKNYFDDKRWEDLIIQFKNLCFDIYGIPSNSLFSTTLRAGISCLKTLNCINQEYQYPYKCPVCSPYINEMVKIIPFTHRVTSSLICRITGDVMDEHNPPYITKDNQVYSQKGIEKMKNDKEKMCPITKKEINWDECKKIFLS
ncbi:hypothetical protein ABPG74_017666 [Tetrahymena malaccensis]